MKKVLAVLTVFFIALANNLSPVQVEHTVFQSDCYYEGRTHTSVDYQSMYSKYIDSSVQMSDGCRTTPIASKATDDRPTSNSGKYWFIESKTKDVSKYTSGLDSKDPMQIGAKDGDVIIAPAGCTITSSARKSRNGTQMEVTCGNYKITFSNLARWYCCIDRKPKDIDATFQHTKDAKGTRLSKGDVLAIATKNTEVSITDLSSGNAISIIEFYE